MALISTSTMLISFIVYISIISLSVYQLIEDEWDFSTRWGNLINALFLLISLTFYLYGKINSANGFLILAFIISFICLFANWIYIIFVH